MKLSLVLLLVIILTSCQHKKPQTQFSSWQQVSQWSFTGKMAINTGQDSGSGKVNWSVSKDFTKAKFKAPLGQGSWEITETDSKANLISSRNGESFADNAEILINKELGWNFPWKDLHYWLRGYTVDEKLVPHQELPESLNYDGWQITYQNWMQTPIGWLPKKIKARKPPYSLKLIIYHWDIK